MKKVFAILLLCAVVPASYGQSVAFKIIQDGQVKELNLTQAQIKTLPQDSATVRTKPGQPLQTWYGARLSAVLKKVGVDPSKLGKLVVSAPDGYVSVLTGKRLKSVNTGLLAYRLKGEAVFPEKFGGLRLVYPDERAMYWVNNIDRVVAQYGSAETPGRFRLYPITSPTVSPLVERGGEGGRIAMAQVVKTLAPKATCFHVLSRDSLYREYDVGRLLSKLFLLSSPDSTWRVDGPDVPPGLKTRDVIYLQVGEHGLFLKPPTSAEFRLWRNTAFKSEWGSGLDKSECGVNVVKADGYRHPSMKQRHWILGKWSLERLIQEEFADERPLNYLEFAW